MFGQPLILPKHLLEAKKPKRAAKKKAASTAKPGAKRPTGRGTRAGSR